MRNQSRLAQSRMAPPRPAGHKLRLVGLALVFTLIAAACGSDSDQTDQASDTSAPAATAAPTAETTEATEAEDTAAAAPLRVVSLSPTHTEMMFAIGAGDLLIAVDQFSNYPEAALALPNELSGYEPNVEAIAALEPDLVLIGGDFTGLGDQLTGLGIESWDGPSATSLGDTYSQIEQLGALTDRVGEAAELVLQIKTDVDRIVADTAKSEIALTFYHELDPTFYSADSSTFVGELYSMLGLENIADGDESESFGFPQLNAEFIVSANPDLIFLADTKCCGESADTVGERDGWDAMAAVQNGNVIEMDDDIASRWGPRVVDFLGAISAAMQEASVDA